MRTAIIAAAVLGLVGMQAPGRSPIGTMLAPAAHADALDRYQGGATLQHMSAPQRTQAEAQSSAIQEQASRYAQGYPTAVRRHQYAQGIPNALLRGHQYAAGLPNAPLHGQLYAAGVPNALLHGRDA